MSIREGKSQTSQGRTVQNSKVKSTISRAEAIQQREQLRQMVLNKFITDLAKNNKKKQAIIEDEVELFFRSQKVTESTLKELKARVYAAVNNKANSQVSDDNRSQRSVGSNRSGRSNSRGKQPIVNRQASQDDDARSVRSNVSKTSSQRQYQQYQAQQQQQRSQNDDNYSDISSKAPQSVYYVEGDEEDEWATLVKFDTELYKKEQELERLRQEEFKKKMKTELDKQLVEKRQRKDEESVEERAFVHLQGKQLDQQDKREKQKEDDKTKKILLEKKQRDKQVHEENQRKRHEKKREKELDEMLVHRLLQEKEQEEQEQLNKKEKERLRLLQMMHENEEYRAKADKEAQQEKDNDIKLQQEYTRLLVEMEEQRDLEKKNREDKIKRIMSAFADSVVKDQKQIIREEDNKMMKHIMEQNAREQEDDFNRKVQVVDQKKEMRAFLQKQMDEKQQQKVQENEVNRMQADIWAKDRTNYMEHERQKGDYIRMVNKKHQEILKEQMSEQGGKKKRGKMTVEELLQNKARLRDIVDKNPDVAENLKKTTVEQQHRY